MLKGLTKGNQNPVSGLTGLFKKKPQ